MSVCAEKRPELLMPHLARLVNQLPKKEIHPAVKRNVVRLLQFVEIPKRMRGKVFSHCVDLIDDPKEPIAVRCFSITVARKIAENQPALLAELKLVVGKHAEHASAGLKVRMRHVLSGST